ncbi:SDR family NAD(P)-dependent oxidoreductase [Microbacterium halophytorum]|uniref:SDR family NAD(P)-dependent oxidoreductase n=1 Tax=Microbacterium halophytorum TaxID=2067568 RepID=UPI000CFB7654|nr:SDR family NAD(P)-dependent oxidoreductase [Microbacterium halophytorum]
MARLENKTALVTGSGSGIGEAVAKRFAAEGARVVIADRDASAAERVAGEIGAAARPSAVDISQEEQVSAAFAELSDAGWAPNVVVANAGVQLFGHDAKVADLDLDTWRRTVDINLTGTFLTVKHAVRSMLASGGGSIILTGSPTGVTGEGSDFTAYSTTKAGIHGMGRTVAAAYATQGIRVNTVVPSYVETPLVAAISGDPTERAAITSRIPMGRPATPDDLTGVMTFLASDDSAFATGAMFTVDGGMTNL